MNGDGNFKMRCINNGSCFDVDSYSYTVGKIYEVKDGCWFDNDGDDVGHSSIKNIDDVNSLFDSKFELVEEENPVKERMQKIAEMLGVELYEDFNIIVGGELLDCSFEFTEMGLVDNSNCTWDNILVNLLRGLYKVQKLTWKPKDGDFVYYFDKKIVGVIRMLFDNQSQQKIAMLKCGWLFKTREEAEANKDCVLKEYAEVMEK